VLPSRDTGWVWRGQSHGPFYSAWPQTAPRTQTSFCIGKRGLNRDLPPEYEAEAKTADFPANSSISGLVAEALRAIMNDISRI
jgi:hypothetical protein